MHLELHLEFQHRKILVTKFDTHHSGDWESSSHGFTSTSICHSATLELGTLKRQLAASENCLVSLIGEIDGVIEQVRNAPGNQQAINVVLNFEQVAANRIHDLCGCTLNPSGKMLYTIWTPPYGPGNKCMTAQEAEEYKAKGGNVVPLNQPCE